MEKNCFWYLSTVAYTLVSCPRIKLCLFSVATCWPLLTVSHANHHWQCHMPTITDSVTCRPSLTVSHADHHWQCHMPTITDSATWRPSLTLVKTCYPPLVFRFTRHIPKVGGFSGHFVCQTCIKRSPFRQSDLIRQVTS